MTVLQGTMQDGTVVPVQVDAQGRLVAEGIQGPPGPPGEGVSHWQKTGSDLYYNQGRVGIGTSTPSQLLHCERTTAGVTALFGVNDGTFNPRLVVYGGSTGTTIQNTWSTSASNLIFANGGAAGSGTEAMRIDSSNRLLVGTNTSPGSAPDGAVAAAGGLFLKSPNGSWWRLSVSDSGALSAVAA
jgi:hypothetical protein